MWGLWVLHFMTGQTEQIIFQPPLLQLTGMRIVATILSRLEKVSD